MNLLRKAHKRYAVLFWIFLFFWIAPVRARTPRIFYVDYVGGLDTYDGTEQIHTTGTTGPFQHAPKSNNATDVAATINLTGDDSVIYKGGVTWPFPHGLWPMTASGSSGHNIYIGVDLSWYSGGSWSRPVLDNEYTYQVIYYMPSIRYVTIDNIEMKRIQVADPGEGGIIDGIGQTDNILMTNLYLHGWRLTGTGQRIDGKQGAINMNLDNGVQAQTIVLEDSELSNAENTGDHTNNGYGTHLVGVIRRTNIHDMPAATIHLMDYDGGEVYNIGSPSGNFSAGIGIPEPNTPHDNVIYNDPGALFASHGWIRNAYVHDADGGLEGLAMCLNQGGTTVDIYNNIFAGIMPASGSAIALDTYNMFMQTGGYCNIHNNLFYMVDSGHDRAISCVDVNIPAGRPPLLGVEIINNYFIGSGTVNPLAQHNCVQGNNVDALTIANNLPSSGGQDPATAIAQSYIQANRWAPQNGLGSTIGAGYNNTAFLMTDILGIARTAPVDIGPYQYVGGVVPSLGSSRPGRMHGR